jgi:hypothetical protein
VADLIVGVQVFGVVTLFTPILFALYRSIVERFQEGGE